jgi:hypothetical protein
MASIEDEDQGYANHSKGRNLPQQPFSMGWELQRPPNAMNGTKNKGDERRSAEIAMPCMLGGLVAFTKYTGSRMVCWDPHLSVTDVPV